jgi:hypothetical protein
MLLTDARRPARTDATGELIPLEAQDRTLWDREQIEEGARDPRPLRPAGADHRQPDGHPQPRHRRRDGRRPEAGLALLAQLVISPTPG